MKANQILALAGFMLVSCHKTDVVPDSSSVSTTAYIVGFDPCTSGNGLVLKLSSSSDTVTTYNLPSNIYSLSSTLFQGSAKIFLFPPSEQNKYKIAITYRDALANERVNSLCQGNINLADFNRATKGRQVITITAQKAN